MATAWPGATEVGVALPLLIEYVVAAAVPGIKTPNRRAIAAPTFGSSLGARAAHLAVRLNPELLDAFIRRRDKRTHTSSRPASAATRPAISPQVVVKERRSGSSSRRRATGARRPDGPDSLEVVGN